MHFDGINNKIVIDKSTQLIYNYQGFEKPIVF